MKSKIDTLIPFAVKAIQVNLVKENLVVDKEYVGYISSFATGIRQSGLLATVAMFSNSTQGKEAKEVKEGLATKHTLDPKNILNAILHILRQESTIEEKNLFDYLLANQDNALLRKQIENAAIAIKLSLRTFNLVKS